MAENTYRIVTTPISENYGMAAKYVSAAQGQTVTPLEWINTLRLAGIYAPYRTDNRTGAATIILPRVSVPPDLLLPYQATRGEKLIEYKKVASGLNLRNFYQLTLDYATAYDLAIACAYAAIDTGTILQFKMSPEYGFLNFYQAATKLQKTTIHHSFEDGYVTTFTSSKYAIEFRDSKKPVPLWTPHCPVSMQAYGKAIYVKDKTTAQWFDTHGKKFGFERDRMRLPNGNVVILEEAEGLYCHFSPHILGFQHINADKTRLLMDKKDVLHASKFVDPSNGRYGMIY